MSDIAIEIQEFGIDTYGLIKKCSMCKDTTDTEELELHEGKCKFCSRKGRTAGFSNMGVPRATANARLDTHQNVLEK